MNLTAEEMNEEFEKETGRKPTDDSTGPGTGVGGFKAGNKTADFRMSGKA